MYLKWENRPERDVILAKLNGLVRSAYRRSGPADIPESDLERLDRGLPAVEAPPQDGLQFVPYRPPSHNNPPPQQVPHPQENAGPMPMMDVVRQLLMQLAILPQMVQNSGTW